MRSKIVDDFLQAERGADRCCCDDIVAACVADAQEARHIQRRRQCQGDRRRSFARNADPGGRKFPASTANPAAFRELISAPRSSLGLFEAELGIERVNTVGEVDDRLLRTFDCRTCACFQARAVSSVVTAHSITATMSPGPSESPSAP